MPECNTAATARPFRYLLLCHIAAFWLPFVLLASDTVEEKGTADVVFWFAVCGLVGGAVTLGILIFRARKHVTHKFCWISVPIAAIPFFGTIGYAMAWQEFTPKPPYIITLGTHKGAQTVVESSDGKKGPSVLLIRKQIFAGAWVLALALAVFFVSSQWFENENLDRLKSSGQMTTGQLQKVTMTTGRGGTHYTFDVQYAGRTKVFRASRGIFEAHTIGDGDYTKQYSHHPVDVIFLPEDPEVAELPGMLEPSFAGYWVGCVAFAYAVCFGKPVVWLILRKRLGR